MHANASAARVAVVLSMLASSATAGTFHTELLAKSSDPSSLDRKYQVYVPDGAAADGTAPLVTVLHGCEQTEQDMIDDTGFTELADRNGFIVAFPFVTSVDPLEPGNTNCWRFWFPNERTQGSGEVGDVRRVIARVEADFHTDPDRRYVAGLSSGAAMAVDVAVAYSEDIAAAGSVAGLPYAEGFGAVTTTACGLGHPVTNDLSRSVSAMAEEQETPAERRLVPLMVIQSINDCVVSIENGADLRKSWIAYYQAEPEPAEEADCTTEGVWCRQARFIDAEGRTVVETLFYQGQSGQGTHYWPGDDAGPFANATGPSASAHLWDFFADKRLAPDPDVDLAVTDATVSGDTVTLQGTTASATPVTGLAVRLDGDRPQSPQTAALAADGGWSATFGSLAADTFYTPVLTATLSDGRTVTRSAHRVPIGAPLRLTDAVADFLHHGFAKRIGVPPASCANPFPGVCDEDSGSLLLVHGPRMPFELYSPDGERWYADPANAMAP